MTANDDRIGSQGFLTKDVIAGMRRLGKLLRLSGAEEIRNLERNLRRLRGEKMGMYEVLGPDGEGMIRIRAAMTVHCPNGWGNYAQGMRAVEAGMKLLNDYVPGWAELSVKKERIVTEFVIKEIIHAEILAKIDSVQKEFTKFMDRLMEFDELHQFWTKEEEEKRR